MCVSTRMACSSFSNGAQWKKLDLSPTYTESVSGQKAGVIQRIRTALS